MMENQREDNLNLADNIKAIYTSVATSTSMSYLDYIIFNTSTTIQPFSARLELEAIATTPSRD